MSIESTTPQLTLAATLLNFRYRALRLCLYLLTLWLLGQGYLDAQEAPTEGAVAGTVFIADAEGRSYMPGATVALQGPEALQAVTDEKGQYSFSDVEPGQYTLIATLPGLQSEQDITIDAGAATNIELELKPVSVQTSVTVSDTASDEKVPTVAETITGKTIADAPNVNERFESLLPLVPGVVRGPDGRINLKGARNT